MRDFADKTEVIVRFVVSNELGLATLVAAALTATWLVALVSS